MLPNLYFIYKDILAYNEKGQPVFPASNAGNEYLPWFVTPDNKVEEELKKHGANFPYVINHKTSPDVIKLIHSLSSNQADRYLDNSYNNISTLSFQQALNTPEVHLILPIVLFSDEYFFKKEITPLSVTLKTKIREGKLKVLFIIPTECWFSTKDQHFIWLEEYAKVNELPIGSLIALNPNFNSKKNYYKYLEKNGVLDFMTVMEYDYFRYSLWFYENMNLLSPHNKYKVFQEFQQNLRTKAKGELKNHFLCLNRTIRPHRIFIFAQIASDEKLRALTDLSMGSIDPKLINFAKTLKRDLKDDYAYSKVKLLNFLQTYDQSLPYVYDVEDIEENNQATTLNLKAHLETFVNIVTETSHEENAIFFTEKTFKPIMSAQPFIMVSSPFTLKKLHEHGFKTFSDFWDESYDEETDFTRRMEKIVEVMYEIASWDLEKCKKVYLKMEKILKHNVETLMNTSDLEHIHEQLSHFPE